MAAGNNDQNKTSMARQAQIIQYNRFLEQQRRALNAPLAGLNKSPRLHEQAPRPAQLPYMQQEQIAQQCSVGNLNAGGMNSLSSLSPQAQAAYLQQIQQQRPTSALDFARVNGMNGNERQHTASASQQHVPFGLPYTQQYQIQQQLQTQQLQAQQLRRRQLQAQQNPQAPAQFNGYNQFGDSQKQQQQQFVRLQPHQAQSQQPQAGAAMKSPMVNSPALTPPQDAIEMQQQQGARHPDQQVQDEAASTAPMPHPTYVTPPSNTPKMFNASSPAQQNLQAHQQARAVSLSNTQSADEALKRLKDVSPYRAPIQDKLQQQQLQDRLRAHQSNGNAVSKTNGNQQSPYSTPRQGKPPQQQPQQRSLGTKRKHQEEDPEEQQAIMETRRKRQEEERQIQQQQQAIRKRQEEELRRQKQAQAHKQRLQEERDAAEHRERVRIAEQQRLEKERRKIRKEQLKKDPSAIYRHYNEYLDYHPLGPGERRNQYLNNLLANRRMPDDPHSELGLAIQFAKDHWEWYLEFNTKEVKRAAEDQRKVLEKRGEKVPRRREER